MELKEGRHTHRSRRIQFIHGVNARDALQQKQKKQTLEGSQAET